MKKRIIIALAIIIAFVLFFPAIQTSYDDGGTREYTALTYKIVKWNRMEAVYSEGTMVGIDMYEKTKIYFFPDNFKSIDELWEIEAQSR